MNQNTGQKVGLILSGGGARGAYQTGVLKGLAEILPEKHVNPFKIISGVSAGAINSAKLASDIESFSNAVEKLIFLWSQITTDQVFKADILSMNKLSFGLLGAKQKKLDSLLDTAPLLDLLNKHCNFEKIKKNLDDNVIESLIITANNYSSGTAISFVQTSTSKLAWKDSRRLATLAKIDAHHVMASSAIPILFPPVKVGTQYYGDGCVRNNTPCSPAIRMGADKIFVIGVRTQMSAEVLTRSASDNLTQPATSPSVVRILNALLNAVLLDSVEQDVHRIQRINQLVALSGKNSAKEGFKEIPALCISPSEDIGELARHHAHHLPRLIRMTISALGSLDEASEILSYLLFEPHFCRKLIEMGYNDAINSRKQIEEFFLV
ncbi:MAG: patatin-like phospholipase family protein [Bdellovibrionota bacterium]